MNFNIDEVFEIAEQIEVNGSRFYRQAAELSQLAEHKNMLLKLAEMEDQHQKTFALMREKIKQTKQSLSYDPNQEAALFLQAFASGYVFDPTADSSALIKGQKSMADILHLAIGFEKDSIVFYLGIEKILLNEDDIVHVRAIIKEEMGHITLLARKLDELN
jgi:rubrerythrin